MYQNSTQTVKSIADKNHTEGFTLVEILIVIAIIATLASVVIPNAGGIFSGQQEKIAKLYVKSTSSTPLLRYMQDVGTYPTTEQGLNALLKAPTGKESKWKGPYIDKIPEDPWGNPYQYQFPGTRNAYKAKGYDIWSLGQNVNESTDDIGNWE